MCHHMRCPRARARDLDRRRGGVTRALAIGTFVKGVPHPDLALMGGKRRILTPTPDGGTVINEEDITQAIAIIRNRS